MTNYDHTNKTIIYYIARHFLLDNVQIYKHTHPDTH